MYIYAIEMRHWFHVWFLNRTNVHWFTQIESFHVVSLNDDNWVSQYTILSILHVFRSPTKLIVNYIGKVSRPIPKNVRLRGQLHFLKHLKPLHLKPYTKGKNTSKTNNSGHLCKEILCVLRRLKISGFPLALSINWL